MRRSGFLPLGEGGLLSKMAICNCLHNLCRMFQKRPVSGQVVDCALGPIDVSADRPRESGCGL